MIAGTLSIEMVANMARLQQDMNQAKGMVGSAMKGIESAVAAATKVLGALGVGLSVGMFVRFVDGAIEAMGAMHELSQRTAVSVETLSALELIAKQSGTNMDTVATTVQKLSKNMLEFARDGGSKVGEAFKSIGITQKDAQAGLSNMDKFLPEFAKKLLEGASGGRQVALAQELMSKSGANLLPFLHQLAEAGKLNAKYSAEQAKAADDFKDSTALLRDESSKLGILMANTLLPALNDIVGAMIRGQKEGGLLTGVFEGMKEAFAAVLQLNNEGDLNRVSKQIVGITDLMSQLENTPGRRTTGGPLNDKIKELHASLKPLIAERDRIEATIKAIRELAAPSAPKPGGTGPAIIDEGDLKKRLKMIEDYRKMDAASWVKHIDETTAEYDRGLAEEAKLTEQFYKDKAKLDAADMAAVFAIIDAEQEHSIAVGAAMTAEMSENHKELEELTKVAKSQAEDAKRAQVDMWRDVDRVAHDTFTSIFDSGKSAFDRLRDTLKNGLYSLLYQMTIRPFLVQIVTSSAGAGVAQSVFPGAGGGGNPLSLLSSGTSLLQMLGGSIGGSFGAGLTYAGSSGVGILGGLTEALTGGGSFGFGAGAALPGIGLALGALSLGKMLFGKEKTPAVGVGYRYQGDFDPTQGTSNLAMLALNNKNELEAVAGSKVQKRVDMFDDAIKPVFEEFQKLAGILKLDSSSIGKTAFDFTTSGIGNEHDAASRPAVAAQLLEKWAEQLPGLKEQAKANETLTETLMRLSEQRLAENAQAESIATDERERAAGLARQQRDLNIQIVELEGRAADAMFHRRVDELEALDPTLHATQKLVWAMQDQATAAEEAARTAETAARAEAERMAAIQNAEGVLRSAYERQASDLGQAIVKWADAAKTLRDYGDSLTGVGAGGMSYSGAAARFAIVAAQARAGSSDAMGNLPSVSEAFRLASERNATTSIDYQRDLAGIVNTVFGVADVADRQGSAVQQQLDAMRSAVSKLVNIEEKLVSLDEATERLKALQTRTEAHARKTADTIEAVTRGDLSFSTQ